MAITPKVFSSTASPPADATMVEEEKQVAHALRLLRFEIDRHAEVVEKLYHCIGPVLHNAGPDKPGGENIGTEQCELAGVIIALTSQLEIGTNGLVDILDRLEL